jgi:hypothetical protein
MASGLSATVCTALGKNLLGFSSGTFVTPTVCAIALHTAALGTAKAFASEWPTVNTNYARITIGVGATNWILNAFLAGTGTVFGNAIQVQSAAATAGTAFPLNLSAVSFNDSATVGAGNMDWFADVSTVSVPTGQTIQFQTNAAANLCDILLTFG